MGMLCKVEKVMKKNSLFYDELKCECDMYSTGDLVISLVDLNGHIDGFNRVHGWYGLSRRNLKGRMLLVLSGEGIMCVKYMV